MLIETLTAAAAGAAAAGTARTENGRHDNDKRMLAGSGPFLLPNAADVVGFHSVPQ